MLLTDVHAHLDLFSSEELEGVLERAAGAGVKAIITNGVDIKSNRASLELAKSYSIVKAALGLYPVDALKLSDEEIDAELKFMKGNSSKISAIGEIGLDYLKTDERERQKSIFLKQIELAKKISKPVIVHSRKAEADVVDLLISSGAKKVVMHCCMANMKTAKKAADAGFYFSIPSLILRSSHFKKLVEVIPSSQLLTETDAPFLSPYAGKKSEPAMVAEAVKEIAGIKRITAEECANIVFGNYQSMFT